MDFQQGLVKPAGKVWFAFAVDPIHSAAVLQGKELIFGEVRNVFPDQAQSLRFAVTVIQRQAEQDFLLQSKPLSQKSRGLGILQALGYQPPGPCKIAAPFCLFNIFGQLRFQAADIIKHCKFPT